MPPLLARSTLTIAAAMLASGMAIVATLLFNIPLSITLPVLLLACLAYIVWRIRSFVPEIRSGLYAVMRLGVVIGIWATLAYDVSRYLLVTLFAIDFWPFKTFPLFGYSLLGRDASVLHAWIAGTVYHILNGLTFAISYCLVLGGRTWSMGIAWAFALEAIMFSLYPGWLNLEAVMVEFTLVSCVGHFAYGATLGILSQRRMFPGSLMVSLTTGLRR